MRIFLSPPYLQVLYELHQQRRRRRRRPWRILLCLGLLPLVCDKRENVSNGPKEKSEIGKNRITILQEWKTYAQTLSLSLSLSCKFAWAAYENSEWS